MFRSNRLALVFVLLVAVVTAAQADIVLLGGRTDSEEITELRFTAPSGCVITGLGFRAHQDNITTMHCRYHRLTADGKLVDPQEIRLGYEADHDCEAKIYLPDDWVMVGFGAAAEPEWDVTLLRVWARKLNPDGTLGEIKVFSDGFNPTRGPERFVLIEESDRALTGAGLRFHFNDIIGIYGRSQRVFNLDPEARARVRDLKISGWLLDGLDGVDAERLLGDMKRHGVSRLDIRLNGSPVTALKDLTDRCKAAGVETYLWTGPVRVQSIEGLLSGAPSLTGLVIDLSLPFETRIAPSAYMDAIAKSNRRPNRHVYVRTSGIPKWLERSGLDLILSGGEAGIYPQNADLGDRQVMADLQISLPAALTAGLPDVRIDDMSGRIIGAASAGAGQFIVNVHAGGEYLPDSVNSMALTAAELLVRHPFQPTDALWDRLSRLWYGKAAEQAKFILQSGTSANDLIFGVRGLHFLWDADGIADVREARLRLRRLANSESQAIRSVAEMLLAPGDQITGRADLEGETAGWLVKQCVSAAEAAVEKADEFAAIQALGESIAVQQQAVALSQAVSKAFMRTQLYARDAAPSTLGGAKGALSDLEKVVQEAPAALASGPMLDGLDEFTASARKSLDESAEKAPIARAFRKVEQLSASGDGEAAAASLQEIMTSEEYIPHLTKHWPTISDLAAGLPALGNPDAGVEIRWGGDGRWKLEKVAGRWCAVSYQDFPCIYFNVPGEPVDPPADYVVAFEYFDKGDWQIHFQYDSDYPPDQERQYHPVEPLQLTNTNTWKEASFTLTNCLFSSGQNMEGDMRFLSGSGAHIRNVRLTRK